jgi:predicted DNA-binding transcriptional regulator AlpA
MTTACQPPITTVPKPRRNSRRLLIPPALLRRKDAAAFLGIGGSTLDRLTAAGLVPAPIKLAGSVCWSRGELAEFCRHGCPPRTEWAARWNAIVTAGTRIHVA